MTHFEVHPGDHAPYFEKYVSLMRNVDVVDVLHQQRRQVLHFLSSIPNEKADYAYEPGKWTVKQAIQHINDTERIFAFRLLAMSRGETQPIPGFEQDDYMAGADVSGRSLSDLHDEFESIRDATLTLVHSITPEQAMRKGIVSGHPLTARAVPFMIAGHVEHHLRIFAQRYGLQAGNLLHPM